MRIAKYVILGVALSILTTLLLVTVGFFNDEPVYYISALWLAGFLIVVILYLTVRAYRRFTSRLGTAAERLSGLAFLQERRYEQLSGRLDRLELLARDKNEATHSTTSIFPEHSPGKEIAKGLAELEDINARLQRAERRILGRLENEMFAGEARDSRLRELVSELSQEKSES